MYVSLHEIVCDSELLPFFEQKKVVESSLRNMAEKQK